MRRLKRFVLVGCVILAIAFGAMVGTWFYIGRPGPTPVEDWIGRHIAAILEGYITPEVSFAEIDYRRPRTVFLRDFGLTRNGVRILSVEQVLLELAEVPREGRPIRIERIELDAPRVVMEKDTDHSLIGWSGFIRSEALENPESIPPGRRLSDVLVLKNVQVRRGEVRYVPGGEHEPMILPGIELALATPPDANEPDWHGLSGTLHRDPVFQAEVAGRINLDTALLELSSLKFAANLGQEQYETLPPALQEILRRHRVRGRIDATFQGRVPLRDPTGAKGTFTAKFQDIRLRISQAALVLASGHLRAGLPNGPIRLEVNQGSFTHGGRRLLAARRLIAESLTLPRALPVEVSRLEADGPQASLIADPTGGFVGWNRLGARSNGHETAPANGGPGPSEKQADDSPQQPRPRTPSPLEPASLGLGTAATAPAESAGPANPYIRIQEAEIRGGRFIYGLLGGDRPLTLRSIHINLRPPPTGDDRRQLITASTHSDELFHSTLTGKLDLAQLVLDLDRFTLQARVAEEAHYSLLPEAIGTLFRRHGATGDMLFTFQGRVPFADMARLGGQGRLELSDAQLQFAGVDMPIERAAMDFDVPVRTVVADVSNLALVADDLAMLEIGRARFDLTGPPRGSQPLDVRNARFEHPRLRFVQAPEPETGLLGWRKLIHPDTPMPRLSEFARFQHMAITGGLVHYDDNDGQGDPMLIDGINMEFNTPPVEGAPGWYRLIASIHRKNLFDMELDGRINPDAPLLEFSRLQFDGELGEPQYGLFPPVIQDALRRHEIRGKLALVAGGKVPLDHLRNATATIDAELTNAHMALDQTVWPIDRVSFNTTLDRRGLAARYSAEFFGGRATGDVTLALDRPRPLRVTWKAADVRMENTLRVVQGGMPKYSGRLSTSGSFSLNLHEGRPSLSGGGNIQVAQGKLVRLPVIRAIVAAVSTATLGLVPTHSDSAQASFQLAADHILVNKLAVVSDPIDLEASGRIHYDKTVDMRAIAHAARNVGRGIGTGIGRIGELGTFGLLGRFSEEVGEVFGGVGDAVAIGERVFIYRITGPLSDPRVSLNGLGR